VGIKYVYVSGPIQGDGDTPREINCREAMLVGERIFMELNVIPFVPHTGILWNMVTPMPEKYWVEWSYEWVERCDAVLRIGGYSAGGSGEVERAKELGIPVFFSFGELKRALEAEVEGGSDDPPAEQVPPIIEKLQRLFYEFLEGSVTEFAKNLHGIDFRGLGEPFEKLPRRDLVMLEEWAERAFECVMGGDPDKEPPRLQPLILRCWKCGASLGVVGVSEGFRVQCLRGCVDVHHRDYMARCLGGAALGPIKGDGRG